MSLTTQLAYPNARPVYLLEITAGDWVRNWVADGSGYEVPYTTRPSSVKYNGAALVERANRAAADAAGDSWVDETSAASPQIYIVLSGGNTPWTAPVQVFLTFRYGTCAKIFNNQLYEGRIKSLPSLSLRVEQRFTGITQIGGGSLSLENTDGFFNAFRNLQWDAGETVLRMGCDVGSTVMAYSDYEVKGKWNNGEHSADDNSFKLQLIEKKNRLRNQIPFEKYDAATYPRIDQNAIGKTIPLAYGTIYGAPAVCVDVNAKRFKIAGHAVYSIDAVRYKPSNGLWSTVTPTTTDPANGEFTWTTWNGTDPVVVDFRGKKNGDGTLMENYADVVEDLLSYVGETNLHSATLTDSYNALDVGAVLNGGTGERKTLFAASLNLNKPVDLLKVINEVNMTVGAYLFIGVDGSVYWKVFEPKPGESLTKYTEADLLSFQWEYDSKEVISSCLVSYAKRETEEWNQTQTYEDEAVELAHGFAGKKQLEVELPIHKNEDALYWAQRAVAMLGEPLRVYSASLPWKGVLIPAGEFVHIDIDNNGNDIDAIFEVLEWSVSLLSNVVNVKLGDMKGLGECGFMSADGATLPARLGGGSLDWDAAWSDDKKLWARQNALYCCDANGFATSSDSESFGFSKVI